MGVYDGCHSFTPPDCLLLSNVFLLPVRFEQNMSARAIKIESIVLGTVIGLTCSYYTWKPFLDDPQTKIEVDNKQLEMNAREELIKKKQQEMEQREMQANLRNK